MITSLVITLTYSPYLKVEDSGIVRPCAHKSVLLVLLQWCDASTICKLADFTPAQQAKKLYRRKDRKARKLNYKTPFIPIAKAKGFLA